MLPRQGRARCALSPEASKRALLFGRCHTVGVDEPAVLDGLTNEQRAFALASERRWRLAHQLAARAPGTDVGDLYHALGCLQLSPAERLRRGLARGRLRSHAR